MVSKKSTEILRVVSGVLALILFVGLSITGKHQLWMLLFGASAILSVFFGRFYCSWICPMNTAFKGISGVYNKLKIPRLKTPGFLKNKVLRVVFIVLFAALFVLQKRTKTDLNIFLYITLFSLLVTLFFEEEFWHRRMCPFGTIFSLTSRPARYSLTINEEACIACGKCQKVCPTSSIITLENQKRRNIPHECLLCGRCAPVCPTQACLFEMKRSNPV